MGLAGRHPIDAVLLLSRHFAETRAMPLGLKHRIVAEAAARRAAARRYGRARGLRTIPHGRRARRSRERRRNARGVDAVRARHDARARARRAPSPVGNPCCTAQSAENRPGAPSSASTQRPEFVGERRHSGRCRSGMGLDRRVLAEHVAGLGRHRQIELAGRDRLDAERRQKLAHFGKLARIMRGDHDAALKGAVARLAGERLHAIEHGALDIGSPISRQDRRDKQGLRSLPIHHLNLDLHGRAGPGRLQFAVRHELHKCRMRRKLGAVRLGSGFQSKSQAATRRCRNSPPSRGSIAPGSIRSNASGCPARVASRVK